MRQSLNAAQVAELAELLADTPRRTRLIDEVLQAAAEGRGMTLVLADLPARSMTGRSDPASRRRPRGEADANHQSARHQ
jgi:hypothetical protein